MRECGQKPSQIKHDIDVSRLQTLRIENKKVNKATMEASK